MTDLGPLRHVKNLPVEVAHQVMACSDLVWLFGGKATHWRKPHLMLALQHFEISIAPNPLKGARDYEVHLWEGLLTHLNTIKSHVVYVLYRIGTGHAGWVCLVPASREVEVRSVLQTVEVHVQVASPRELLQ